MGLAACSSTLEKVEDRSNRLMTSWALGKPYTRVAKLGTSSLARLSADQTGFGDMIGSSEYSDGTTLYRLSYFKVGQDGIVKDWATGSVPGTASNCINFIADIFQKCADQALVKQDLAVYDG